MLQGGGALGAYEFGVPAVSVSRPGPLDQGGGSARGRSSTTEVECLRGRTVGFHGARRRSGSGDAGLKALDTLWRDKLTVTGPVPEGWLPTQLDRSLATFGPVTR
jgi:hypothetical protein